MRSTIKLAVLDLMSWKFLHLLTCQEGLLIHNINLLETQVWQKKVLLKIGFIHFVCQNPTFVPGFALGFVQLTISCPPVINGPKYCLFVDDCILPQIAPTDLMTGSQPTVQPVISGSYLAENIVYLHLFNENKGVILHQSSSNNWKKELIMFFFD